MRKAISLLIISAAFLCLNVPVYSQPKAILEIYVGYSLPTGDLKGTFGPTLETFTSNPDSNTYFMKSGYSFAFGLKELYGKKKNFFLSAQLGFNVFHQNVDYNLNTSTPENMQLTMRITSLYVGAGWLFNPRKGINPWVEFGLLGSYFSGVLDDILNTINTQHFLRHTVRLGVQGEAGIDIPINNNVGVIFGTKLSFANIIGKSYEPDDAQNYSLNDKEHVENNATYPTKNITYYQFFGGVSFYFGR
jgi:hypothetical protein